MCPAHCWQSSPECAEARPARSRTITWRPPGLAPPPPSRSTACCAEHPPCSSDMPARFHPTLTAAWVATTPQLASAAGTMAPTASTRDATATPHSLPSVATIVKVEVIMLRSPSLGQVPVLGVNLEIGILRQGGVRVRRDDGDLRRRRRHPQVRKLRRDVILVAVERRKTRRGLCAGDESVGRCARVVSAQGAAEDDLAGGIEVRGKGEGVSALAVVLDVPGAGLPGLARRVAGVDVTERGAGQVELDPGLGGIRFEGLHCLVEDRGAVRVLVVEAQLPARRYARAAFAGRGAGAHADVDACGIALPAMGRQESVGLARAVRIRVALLVLVEIGRA